MSLPPSAQRVQDELVRLGVNAVVRQLDRPTRTAAEAAEAVGCTLGQIAKSLVFRAGRSGRAVLVITSGANRVVEPLVAAKLGEPIERADPDFVRQATGYAIGGVPPVGLAAEVVTFFDQDLLNHRTIWAAAGTPHALFEIDPGELLRISSGAAVRVS